jgi:hypothetical protein
MKKLTTICSLFLLSIATFEGVSAQMQNEFKVKGVHIDFRVEVMTPEAMKELARDLSGFGINTIVMEWEAAFPYDRHATISSPLAWTPEEVTDFVDYAKTVGINVIPLQHCFGHAEYILRHDRYSHLRERFRSEISQICPLHSGAVDLFREVFADMARLHDSEYFHIGGDETYLLGLCPECSKFAEEHGKSQLFVDYISKMCKIVTDMGKKPVLWADIITMYPDAVNDLPEDAILVDWNYGWDVRHFGDIDKIHNSGLEVWGAPAIRSNPDNYYLTDWNKHFNNQRDFIPYAREAGYRGMIMTSWSTSGILGFFWEPGNEVTEMDPIRTVYPMSGFRILLAMYGEAVNNPAPVDPHDFVVRYAEERFGLSTSEGEGLFQILSAPQRTVRYGKDSEGNSVSDILSETKALQNKLYAMAPKSNQKEFEHFRLMFDLRVQYLQYKEIERIFNSPEFSRGMAAELLYRLENEVMSQNASLDRRFSELNTGYIKTEELPSLNSRRARQMNNTADALRAMLK